MSKHYNIFIFGSRSITSLPDVVEEYIENTLDHSAYTVNVLIGDCDGVDSEVQKLLNEDDYEDVTVFTSGKTPRNFYGDGEYWKKECLNLSIESFDNDREYYACKDDKMIEDCNMAIAIWDGHSRASKNNIDKLIKLNKPVFILPVVSEEEMTEEDKEVETSSKTTWYVYQNLSYNIREELSVDKSKMEYLTFDYDNEEHLVHENVNYGKYVKISNPYASKSDHKSRTFYFRFKDAIEAIRNGYGDAITIEYADKAIVPIISVLWFLDRSIGESVRLNTIEAWDGIEFSTCILHNGVDGGVFVLSNIGGYMFRATHYLTSSSLPLTFTNIPDALTHVNNIIDNLALIDKSIDYLNNPALHYNAFRSKISATKMGDINNAGMRNNIYLSTMKQIQSKYIKYDKMYNDDIIKSFFEFGQAIRFNNITDFMDFFTTKENKFLDIDEPI